MNILKKADQIINNRSEEKEREYGDFNESMERAARISSDLCKKEITPEDMFKCMLGLKLSRLANSPKEDTLLDICGYAAGLNNYINKNNNN